MITELLFCPLFSPVRQSKNYYTPRWRDLRVENEPDAKYFYLEFFVLDDLAAVERRVMVNGIKMRHTIATAHALTSVYDFHRI